MRRNNKSSSQNGGYNNQHRRSRHGGGGNGGGNRPRKNWPQLREKYLGQARDALASGDRVLAENYYQHAEHCYRMMVEDGYNPRQQQPRAEENESPRQQDGTEEMTAANTNTGSLPAFITSTAMPSMEQEMAKEPVIVQNWEEN